MIIKKETTKYQVPLPWLIKSYLTEKALSCDAATVKKRPFKWECHMECCLPLIDLLDKEHLTSCLVYDYMNGWYFKSWQCDQLIRSFPTYKWY